jgi:hypothetical protein
LGPQEGIKLNLLGFPYIQDFTSAMSLGEMDIVAQMKTLLQVKDNWYLVNNQGQFTGPITCLKASNSEIFFKPEANQFYVLLYCCLQLQDHLIILDLSLKLDTSIKHYEWDLEKITFSDHEETCSTQWFTVLGDHNTSHTTLASICQALAAK